MVQWKIKISKLKLHCQLYFTWYFISAKKCYPLKKNLSEKAMATHSSTLAWKIPSIEGPGGLQSTGWLRVGHNWATSLSFSLSCIEEGNGNPLQCSWLENPRDGGDWWAAVYRVAQWSESGSVVYDSLWPHGLSLEFSRPDNWSG